MRNERQRSLHRRSMAFALRAAPLLCVTALFLRGYYVDESNNAGGPKKCSFNTDCTGWRACKSGGCSD